MSQLCVKKHTHTIPKKEILTKPYLTKTFQKRWTANLKCPVRSQIRRKGDLNHRALMDCFQTSEEATKLTSAKLISKIPNATCNLGPEKQFRHNFVGHVNAIGYYVIPKLYKTYPDAHP